MDTVMSNENVVKIAPEYQQAIDALKEYMAESGKNQAQIVKEMGRSSGAVSAFLSGKYSTPHAMIPDIMAYIELNRKKKAAPTAPDFAETSLSRLMEASIAYAHVQGLETVIYGDAGVGKTTAAKAYAERERLATYIVARPDCSGYTGVMWLVAKAFGIRERITRNITDAFIERMQGSGRVLIVDEAQFLNNSALNQLRSLSDLCGIGIVLIGNESLYDKTLGKGVKDMDQLRSRVCIPVPVRKGDITYEDIRNVFGKYDIGEDVLKLLYGVSSQHSGLRSAVYVYIQTAASKEGITAKEMAKVIRFLKMV